MSKKILLSLVALLAVVAQPLLGASPENLITLSAGVISLNQFDTNHFATELSFETSLYRPEFSLEAKAGIFKGDLLECRTHPTRCYCLTCGPKPNPYDGYVIVDILYRPREHWPQLYIGPGVMWEEATGTAKSWTAPMIDYGVAFDRQISERTVARLEVGGFTVLDHSVEVQDQDGRFKSVHSPSVTSGRVTMGLGFRLH